MPAAPIFKSAINQASNGTFGWTSKTLYAYQASSNPVKVFEDTDVFSTLIADGYWQKGSVLFKTPYFITPNSNQGRLIKITMYFQMELQGQTIEMRTGLRDQATSNEYVVNQSNSFSIDGGGGTSYCKYECYLNVYDASGSAELLATGQALAQTDTGGRVRSMAINNSTTLGGGFGADYSLTIINKTGAPIFINNLLVEEIG
jgi:hypothetical protein